MRVYINTTEAGVSLTRGSWESAPPGLVSVETWARAPVVVLDSLGAEPGLSSCGTRGKDLRPSVPWFPCLSKRNKSTYLLHGLVVELNDEIFGKCSRLLTVPQDLCPLRTSGCDLIYK